MSKAAPATQVVVNPDLLRVQCVLGAGPPLAAVATALVEDWMPAQDIAPTGWVDHDDDAKPGKFSSPPPREVYADAARRGLILESADHFGTLSLLVYDEQRPGDAQRNTFGHRHCIALDLLDFLKEVPLVRAQASFAAAQSLVDFLAERFDLLGLTMSRDGSAFAPSPPLAGCQDLMRLVRRDEVAAEYADPAVYWRAWPDRRELDADRVLVARAAAVVDELAFKQAIYPAQWMLARAARPGRTRYGALATAAGGFRVRPTEQAYFEAGEGILSAVHHDPSNARVDVTAWAEPGTHIAPREVARLLRWKTDGRLDSGEPVAELRVTFPDRAQARSQQRVLLDIGCRVFHYGAVPTEVVEVGDG